MVQKFIIEYFYDGKNKSRCFRDLHRLNIFIDNCLMNDVPIIRLFERKEFDNGNEQK